MKKANGRRKLYKRNFFPKLRLPVLDTHYVHKHIRKEMARYLKQATGNHPLANMAIDTAETMGKPPFKRPPSPDPGPGPAAAVEDKSDANSAAVGKKRKGSGNGGGANSKRGRGGTVIHGKSGPKFKRARRTKLSKFAKYGMQLQYEHRGTVDDPQCVYLGHGVPVDQIFKSVIYSIVKRLFLDHGVEIENFDAPVQIGANAPATFRYYFDVHYWASVDDDEMSDFTYVHDYSTNKRTYVDIVQNLAAAFDTALTDAGVLPSFERIEMFIGNSTERYDNVARLPLNDCQFEMQFKGKLSIQNTTVANGGEGDQKLFLDRIDTNPVKGLKYESMSATNCILPKIRSEETQAQWKAFLADKDTGLFAIKSTDLAGNHTTEKAGMNVGYYKPVNPRSLRAVKATSARIEPGEIRVNYLKWSTKMKFQRFLEAVYDQVANRATTKYVKFGKVAMFGFEHAMCQSNDSDIQLDYQSEWTIGCRLFYRKVASVPVVRVQ